MGAELVVLIVVTAGMMGFWHWLYHIVNPTAMSGDKWYMRQMAFTTLPISPPYCWRPLLPALARRLGFPAVSYTATFLAPIVVYFYVGGGWTGTACGLMFVGTNRIFSFNIKNPEYAEGLGQFLLLSSLWAISSGSLLAWPLLLLAALCRETLSAILGVVVLFVNPWLLIPLVVGSAASYLSRDEDQENRHPLVEKTAYETLVRWTREKGGNAISYAHTIQPLRGLAFTVPFMWGAVGDFARLGLVALAPIWLLALPASGQSRIVCYAFGLLIPFAAALPPGWLWFVVMLQWFWPVDYGLFNEGGDVKFALIRGKKV